MPGNYGHAQKTVTGDGTKAGSGCHTFVLLKQQPFIKINTAMIVRRHRKGSRGVLCGHSIWRTLRRGLSIKSSLWIAAAVVGLVQLLFMYSFLSGYSSSSNLHDGHGGAFSVHRLAPMKFASEPRRSLRKHVVEEAQQKRDVGKSGEVEQHENHRPDEDLHVEIPFEQQYHNVPKKPVALDEATTRRKVDALRHMENHGPARENWNPEFPTKRHEDRMLPRQMKQHNPIHDADKRERKVAVLNDMENHSPEQAVVKKLKMAKVLNDIEHHNAREQDPILEPILRAGKMYSIGRKDRLGSVVSDMLYAHAFAFAHNVTYAGACFTVHGYPKKETVHLLEELQWTKILNFACPPGVDSSLNIRKPNATALSPLILNDDVYRWKLETGLFSFAWRESIQNAMMTEQLDNPKPKNKRPYEIAVHVRRGDVSPCTYTRRYLTNEHYLKLIDQYTPAPRDRDNRPVHVTVYSESDSFESFDVFRERNYSIELDTEDLALIWKALVTADLAILSRSYFSFVPAAVNPNTVVATEFFQFEPLQGWKRADDALVKETDKQIRKMSHEQCPETDAHDATKEKR